MEKSDYLIVYGIIPLIDPGKNINNSNRYFPILNHTVQRYPDLYIHSYDLSNKPITSKFSHLVDQVYFILNSHLPINTINYQYKTNKYINKINKLINLYNV